MYIVQYSDLIGSITEFPIEIVQKMVERSTEQEKWFDDVGMRTFQINVLSSGRGGFNWGSTPEGHTFWSRIIDGRRFDLFFDRYPCKYLGKTIYIETDGTNNRSQLSKIGNYTIASSCCGESTLKGVYYLDVVEARKGKIKFAMFGTKRYKDTISSGINIDELYVENTENK
jgi:hypothetical protein